MSFLHSAAEYINDLDVPAYIYHLGDRDPSGVNAAEKIEETLRELAPDAEIYFERLAVLDAKLFDWSDEITADCPRKQARNLNAQCGAWCPDLSKVV